MKTDVLIIGSGIAGISLALKLNALHPNLKITLLSKTNAFECNTRYAQGGIAAVMNQLTDSFDSHINDTLECGKGLCDSEVVDMVIKQAPERINELIALGVQFDSNSRMDLELGLEGGHSRARIVHHKDKTGFELEQVLLRELKNRSQINLLENTLALDLLIKNQAGTKYCYGISIYKPESHQIIELQAGTTVLASGGCGQVYINTTNPLVASGDGYAMASRAGADMKHMRFMQFHPTALYQANKQRVSFLITEALRGFGAHVEDLKGNRFLFDYDKRGELATRDVVSAAIMKHMALSNTDHVYLNLRHLDPLSCELHFPGICLELKSRGFDISKDLIPIVPSAHYQCGGIAVSKNAESSIKDLYAIGEVSCTGLHGANRLASNSLLEALVYAHNVALHIASRAEEIINRKPSGSFYQSVKSLTESDIENEITKLKTIMMNLAFDDHTADKSKALEQFKGVATRLETFLVKGNCSEEFVTLRNLTHCAQLILKDTIEAGLTHTSNNLSSNKTHLIYES